jgi:thioredoxin
MKWNESMKNLEKCILIQSEHDLQEIIQKKESFFILFYAGWCPFSQRFLPVFERCAKDAEYECFRMDIDEYPHLCNRFEVEVYPTIVFFEKGKIVERIDGIHGVGLNEQQFKELINVCRHRKD